MSYLVALRKELIELWRTYRFLVAAFLLIFMGLTSPLFAKYTPELIKLVPSGENISLMFPPPTAMDAVTQFVKNISQFGILLALLIGMGSVAQEKDKGTAALMLVKPMPRGTFILAKFTALVLMFAVSILVAGLACYYYTFMLFEALNFPAWLALNALLLLQILVYTAITVFCSTLFRSQAAAGGLSFGILLVLALFSAIPGIAVYLPGELPNWGVRLLMGGTTPSWAAVIVSLVIIVASLLAAWGIFERQEL